MCRVGTAGPHCGGNILEGSLETGAVNAPSRAAGGGRSGTGISLATVPVKACRCRGIG